MDSNTITSVKKKPNNYVAKFKQEVKKNVQINTVKVVPIIRVEFYNEFK